MRCAIIGYGEAGRVFAQALTDARLEVTAYDILLERGNGFSDGINCARQAGIKLAGAPVETALRAKVVISTVTANQAVQAARSVAPALEAGVLYLDLNSTSPMAKRDAEKIVTATGGHFIDGCAMDTVPSYGAAVPIFVSGAKAQDVADMMNPLGFDLTPVGPAVGTASTIKMMRSVVVKGIEALLAEAILGAERAGVTREVLASLQRTYPGLNWHETTTYHLGRMVLHGKRRADEMRASAQTLEGFGVDPFIAEAIANRQQWSADLRLKEFTNLNQSLTVARYANAVARAETKEKTSVT